MQSSMVSMPSPARMKVSGLHSPVSPASTEGRLKIPLPMTPLMMAAVKSQRPMARTRPGDGGAPSASELSGGSSLTPPMISCAP
jgi:hypothetical protein